MKILLIGAGGFLGAVARYGASLLVHRWLPDSFPWGTLAVNASGCLLMGLVMAAIETQRIPSVPLQAFLTVGLLGGYTTFSAFGHETFQLLRTGRTGGAFAYAGASVVVGLAAVWAGRLLLPAAVK